MNIRARSKRILAASGILLVLAAACRLAAWCFHGVARCAGRAAAAILRSSPTLRGAFVYHSSKRCDSAVSEAPEMRLVERGSWASIPTMPPPRGQAEFFTSAQLETMSIESLKGFIRRRIGGYT